MTALRSALFLAVWAVATVVFGLIALLTFPFPWRVRYRVITLWSRLSVWLAGALCGIHYHLLGGERLPAGPAIILAKHQSAWETFAFQAIFPPQVLVIKRELLRVPFFGWGLALLKPIAIDRRAGKAALKQVLTQGRDRLRAGAWVVVFPEGTRMPPGTRGRYGLGGAWLAVDTGVPVVPVAHDAGRYWSRRAFLKRPGTVTVSVGPPFSPEGKTAAELMREVEHWIEAEMARIDPPAGRVDPA